MRIAFRVDSSINMGSGHLMRCLTLANELKHRGADVIFISRAHPGNLISRLEEAFYFVSRLPASNDSSECISNDYAAWLGVTQEQDAAETLLALGDHGYDWLVVDHYGLDVNWERIVRPAVSQILVIDDLANRQHDCDVLLDQNYFGNATDTRYQNRIPTHCKGLFGSRYALLQSDYATLRKVYLPRDGQINRVLVFFGASDPGDQTSKLLEVLSHSDIAHLVVDIVIGANHPNPENIVKMVAVRSRTTLHQNIPSLAGLMVRADLFIGAGGATTWERMSLGLPSLVISIAENQQEFTQILSADGFQFSLPNGKMTSSTEWYEAISELLNNPGRVKQVAEKANKLVDGLGLKRIASLMFGLKALTLTMRYANRADEAMILDWVNDPMVRKQSFHQDVIGEDEHALWFSAKIDDPDCIILIGEDETGLPVGQVRFEINRKRKEALIDVSLDHAFRGMGLSEQLLNKALAKWTIIEPKITIMAEVRNDNRPSQQLFKKCQFSLAPSRRIDAQLFEWVN